MDNLQREPEEEGQDGELVFAEWKHEGELEEVPEKTEESVVLGTLSRAESEQHFAESAVDERVSEKENPRTVEEVAKEKGGQEGGKRRKGKSEGQKEEKRNICTVDREVGRVPAPERVQHQHQQQLHQHHHAAEQGTQEEPAVLQRTRQELQNQQTEQVAGSESLPRNSQKRSFLALKNAKKYQRRNKIEGREEFY